MRFSLLTIGLFGAVASFGQVAFEVASIKPWTSRELGSVYTYPGGRVAFRGCTVEYLIQQAFNTQRFQISGGPGWMRSERYDIDAKPPETSKSSRSMTPYPKAPLNEEQRQMLQSLLAGRFQLHYHRDAREGPVYLLVRGSKPLRMTDSKDKQAYPWSRVSDEGLSGINESMPDLAWRLSQALDRPVQDQTGISGSFDFQITYSSAAAEPDLIAQTFATVQELGLKLEPSKGSVDVIVVERVEKFSAN